MADPVRDVGDCCKLHLHFSLPWKWTTFDTCWTTLCLKVRNAAKSKLFKSSQVMGNFSSNQKSQFIVVTYIGREVGSRWSHWLRSLTQVRNSTCLDVMFSDLLKPLKLNGSHPLHKIAVLISEIWIISIRPQNGICKTVLLYKSFHNVCTPRGVVIRSTQGICQKLLYSNYSRCKQVFWLD